MTSATAHSNGHDPARDVLAEAARRMLPVLAGRLLTAATDRAVGQVETLAGRLGDIAENGLPQRSSREVSDDGDAEGGQGRSAFSTAFAFLAEQARALLDLVVRLLAQAAETLRTATERLRRRRAPEGIDAAEDDESDDAYGDDHDDDRAAV